MLIMTRLRCRTHAVAMDSLPTKDTNGTGLRDGKLKFINACWLHLNKTKSILILLPLFKYFKAKQLFGSINVITDVKN